MSRFLLALLIGAAWGVVWYHSGLSGEWLFYGAGLIGIALTIGTKTRRRHGKSKARAGLARRVLGHH